MHNVSNIPSETPSGMMNTPTRGGPTANWPCTAGQDKLFVVNAPRTESNAAVAAVTCDPVVVSEGGGEEIALVATFNDQELPFRDGDVHPRTSKPTFMTA
jgi:hypothetical protein